MRMRHTQKCNCNYDHSDVSEDGQSGQVGIAGRLNTKISKITIGAGCMRCTMALDVEAATSGWLVFLETSIECQHCDLTLGNNLLYKDPGSE